MMEFDEREKFGQMSNYFHVQSLKIITENCSNLKFTPLFCCCFYHRKASDPLTWQVVSLPLHHNGHYASNSNGTDEMIMRDVRIVLNVAPRTKLGCG